MLAWSLLCLLAEEIVVNLNVFYLLFRGAWIRTTASIVKRYEELTVNISGFTSKLQTVLITVQNFKDGVESMFKWSEQTKKTFERMTAVTFDIYVLQQQIREIKVRSLFNLMVILQSNLPFSYSTTEPGWSETFIHLYIREVRSSDVRYSIIIVHIQKFYKMY